jgi:hypothetical protein
VSDPREDQRLRSALEGLREVAAREDEVTAVLERASRPRRSTKQRAAAGSLVLAVVLFGLMVTIAPGRSALAAAVDRLESFFDGGDAPGTVLPPDEAPNVLNWLQDASPGSPRVLARREGLRLVAYREESNEQACFSLARSVTECGDIAHWETRFSGESLLPLTTTRTDSPEEVALWGVATDVVASVELSYRGRPPVTSAVDANGFVLVAPADLVPDALIARDGSGVEIARADVADLQWRFCTSIQGC